MKPNPATLRAEAKAFANAVRDGDPESYIPTCPEWQLRVLVGHIGQEFRWAAGILRTGAAAAIPDPHEADPGPVDAWPAWVVDGADEFLAAYDKAASPVWTPLGSRPASFWLRRMLHDTTVHRFDACLTTGAGYELADGIAEDGIDERFELLCDPSASDAVPALRNLRSNGETLQFGTGWFVTLTPEGIAYERKTAPADVTVAAPIPTLHLLLARRIPADQCTITGDRDLLDHWLASTAF